MKTLFKTISAAAIAVSLVGVANAQETINIGSNVSEECNIDAVSTGLNITVASDQVVADATIECNYYGNVTVNVGSADGAFVLDGPGSNDIPYSVDYEFNDPGLFPLAELIFGLPFNNEFGPFPIVVDNTTGVLLEPLNAEVEINITPEALGVGPDVGSLFAGSYTDDITLTLTVG